MKRAGQPKNRSWDDVVRAIQTHPDGIAAGCHSVGIREGQYYYHRRRLKRFEGDRQSFTEMIIPSVSRQSEVELRLKNGRSVIIRGEVPPSQLMPIIAMMEGE